MQEELYIKIQNDKQDSEKELTQAEYNELSAAERASGKLFFITDQGYIYKNNVIYGGTNSPGKIFKNGVQYGQNSHSRIYKNGIEYAGGIIIVEIPTVTVGSYTYTGSAQGPTITGLDTDHCTVTNATKTLPGTYTMTISLNDTNGCVWSDGTTTPKTYEYTIKKISVALPVFSNMSYTYDGAAHSPTVTYNSTYCNISGNGSLTNVGSQTVTVSLKDTSLTMWTDGTTANKTSTFSITKASVALPTFSNMTYTYDGNAHSPTVNYNSTYCNISGNESRTDAGSQTVTVSLKSTTNTQWSDGTIAAKTATFTVNKADLPITALTGIQANRSGGTYTNDVYVYNTSNNTGQYCGSKGRRSGQITVTNLADVALGKVIQRITLNTSFGKIYAYVASFYKESSTSTSCRLSFEGVDIPGSSYSILCAIMKGAMLSSSPYINYTITSVTIEPGTTDYPSKNYNPVTFQYTGTTRFQFQNPSSGNIYTM